jgi:hypothetical protein
MSMPISAISLRVIFFAVVASNRLNGPQPLVGSEPRKKFRQMAISGTIARSWNTVAIPTSTASRGAPNRTG